MGKIKKILAGVLVVAIAGSGITAGSDAAEEKQPENSGGYSCERTYCRNFIHLPPRLTESLHPVQHRQ